MSCIGLVHVWIEAVFSLCSISKVETEITAHEWVLSRGHISPCGTGGSRIGLLSFRLAVSLNVSAAQPELCRSTASIAAVTCMGGLWEMERFQLKRAASVLPVWKRRGAESWRSQPSQLFVVRASSTTDLAVKGHNVRFSTQSHLVPSTRSYCWILLEGHCVLWNKVTQTLKHSRFSTSLRPDVKGPQSFVQEHKSRKAETMGRRHAPGRKMNIRRKHL